MTLNKPKLAGLGGYLLAAALTAKDWNDRTYMKLPHVRNRVARMALQSHEGQLFIAMPSRQIMEMAHRYGVEAGQKLRLAFAPSPGVGGAPTQITPVWAEHVYVRTQTLLRAVHSTLAGIASDATSWSHTAPLAAVLRSPCHGRLLAEKPDRKGEDPGGKALEEPDIQAVLDGVAALQAAADQLERTLQQPYVPVPLPEWRLRSPQ